MTDTEDKDNELPYWMRIKQHIVGVDKENESESDNNTVEVENANS